MERLIKINMRIAFIFDALLYGGIERVGMSYLKFLEEDGHDVDVYVLNPKDIEGIIDEVPERFRIHKIPVSPFMCPSRYWYIAKRWWWGKLLFPIVYTSLYLFIHVYGLRFIRFGKYDLAISMAGHFNDLTINAYNLIRSKKKICWLHGALYEYMIISPAYERLYTKIKNLVVLNSFAEDRCLFYNKFLKFNTRKIYNPCLIGHRTINENTVRDLKKKYGDFILMIGRMDPPKNPVGVIKAMEHVYNKYGKTYHLVFVGDGAFKKEYESYANSTQISEYIHFEGNSSDPQNYYKAAKIFAFSSFSEGLPTVLVEAMYFGLPIATSDTSVREILRDGKDGLISDIDDNEALGEDIYSLMSDSKKWADYCQRSQKRFEVSSPEKIKEQFNQYLKELW